MGVLGEQLGNGTLDRVEIGDVEHHGMRSARHAALEGFLVAFIPHGTEHRVPLREGGCREGFSESRIDARDEEGFG